MNHIPNSTNITWAVLLLMGLPLLWVSFLLYSLPFNFDPESSKDVYRFTFNLTLGETPWWYIYINLVSVFFPFILSFDKKVHFYKKWKFLFPAIAITAAFFIIWDVIFTHMGIWGFNERYVNMYLLGLPLGEWLFFFTVPYACIFIHECLLCYFKSDPLKKYDLFIGYTLMIIFVAIGFLNLFRAYTAWTFFLSAGFLLLHILFIPNSYRSRFYIAYIISLLPFAIINGILTGAFNEEPIVIYNDNHNLSGFFGIRFFSIPFDDFIYGFLLIFMCVTFYEFFRSKGTKIST